MRNKFKNIISVLGMSLSCTTLIAQQTYINEEWNISNGTPGQYDQIASAIDPNGNLVYIGNNLNNSNNTDIFLNCIHPAGNVIWQQICPSSATQDDYGVDLKIDALGNIYITGAYHNGNNIDYSIAKYNQMGVLQWQNYYNGNANGDDVPSAIDIDANGNIYVTGTTYGGWTMTDIATIKYDNNGNQQWIKKYNFNNKVEVATDIKVDNAGNIVVLGTSANNWSNSDFIVRKYTPTGTVLATKRHNSPGNGYDLPTELTVDANNNVFVTGTSENGSNKNIKVIAYNSNLQVQWIDYIDNSGNADESFGIVVDNNGDVIITGYSTKTSGGTDAVIVKYNGTSGNQEWIVNKTALIDSDISKARKVKVDVNNNIYVAAETTINGSRDFTTLAYKPTGELIWEKTFNNTTNGLDNSREIIVSNNKVFVTGISANGSSKNITSVKYSTKAKGVPVVTDSIGNPLYVKDELIIHFDPKHIDTSFINNLKNSFGFLSKFVDQAIISKMDSVTNTSWRTVDAFRMFNRLTTHITYSVTRLGDTIPVPKLWAAILVKIPHQEWSAMRFADSLNKLQPDIYYAEVNAIGKLHAVSNDPLLISTPEQEGLIYNSSYPNAHINASPAWDLEVGNQNTKVGVYDEPIYWAHEDFGNGTFSGSKIVGGWDFVNNTSIVNVTNPNSSHGTATSGIIGALRNNGIGIAGIAGGDVQNGNTGCQLFSMMIFDGLNPDGTANSATWDKIAPAILEGAVSNPGYGYGFHIQNHSWGGSQIVNSTGGDLTGMAKMVVRQSFRNQCLFVASRGNHRLVDTWENPSDIKYPACLEKNWVLNVTASGMDGSYKSSTNGDSWWVPFYSNNIDVIAPGTTEIISSLAYSNAPLNITPNCISNGVPNYECFNGTSASAPHVSGVAALMHGYHHTSNGFPNNLAPDDIEHLLQTYATDEGTTGYDDFNGFGRINAGLCMQMLEATNYKVQHVSSNIQIANPVFQGNVTVVIPDNFRYSGVNSGLYTAIKFKVTVTIPHSIGNTQIIDAWVRNSSSDLLGNTMAIYPYSNVTLESYTSSSATLSGYIYFIVQNIATNDIVNSWLPKGTGDNVNWAYSLHLQNNPLSVNEMINESEINIYPNPTASDLNIFINLSKDENISFKIYDIAGKLCYTKPSTNYPVGKNTITLSNLALSNGIYHCVVSLGNQVITKKIIINKL